MAWVKERITDDGDKRFVACYRDPKAGNATLLIEGPSDRQRGQTPRRAAVVPVGAR